ncbi:uncharacterized protein LOC135834877 [Planococcus citri]|uniref:uncharacterized protein LOC135834877 n=1 Tax=Planococcus citri TaxID=170843 RepID=UPI0031F7AB34
MYKELAVLLCLTRFAHLAPSPYQYNSFTTVSSTPPPGYVIKQNLNGDSSPKFSIGYKIQDSASNKVKKEYSNSEYLFPPESSKRPQTFTPDFSYEDYSTSPAPSLLSFPYPGQQKPSSLPSNFFSTPKQFPPTASSKVFVHGHYDKPHVIHDLVGHVITDVAGHKLKHYGEALESGALTEPIIHKLSFAKAALLQLLAIIGPLSAIKTIHVAAKASGPHHHEPEYLEGVPPGAFSEHIDPFVPGPHPHHSSTLSGIIFNLIASLSKFNTEAKIHLIPNLLKIISSSSSASAHASAHH